MMNELYDAVIIGGGPAGLTAAIYLARAKYRTLVIEKDHFGGQITITEEVVNYPGVGRASGTELTDAMRAQAENFGAEFLLAEVTRVNADQDVKRIETTRGDLDALSVLLATGAHPRHAGFAGEEEFRGRGVAYCATCDGEFFTGREVFVVGGGFVAAEESVLLSRYARHVTVLIREDDFTCAESASEAARNNDSITVLRNTEVVCVKGEGSLKTIVYRNNKTGETNEITRPEGIGVFVFAGYEPESALIRGIADLDEKGYVKTDSAMMTSKSGIFAAGDVCIKPLRQVITAAGDGALAAAEMEKYALSMQKKTGLHPVFKGKKKAERNEDVSSALFSPEMKAQLDNVFSRMEQTLVLEVHTDENAKSRELIEYMNELVRISLNKLSVRKWQGGEDTPYVRVLREDGSYAGFTFHGVPGGHEFTSFILGLYNASGNGQSVSDEVLKGLAKLERNVHITILVSLSCTMCPETVTSAERLATLSDRITVDVYDAALFPALMDKYQAMSVPCFAIDDDVYFGKKSVSDLLSLIQKQNG